MSKERREKNRKERERENQREEKGIKRRGCAFSVEYLA